MAIVNERHNPTKPVQVDPKTGKPLPASTPARAASPTLTDSNLGGDKDTGFFGSFFAAKNKKKAAAMEPPPTTLKASGTLSERENIEVEVISGFSLLCLSGFLPFPRANTTAQNCSSNLIITL
jgi:vacuolar protein sorting-associated protein 1